MTPKDREAGMERLRQSLKANFALLARQVGIAIAVTVLWRFTFWKYKIHFPHEDREIFLVTIIFLAVATWILKGQEVFKVIWEQYREMVEAVKVGDEVKIMSLRDERINTLIHLMLAVFAVLADILICAVDYSNAVYGGIAVFVASLVFTLYWAVILTIENPVKRGWIREQIMEINPELLTVSTEEFFKQYRAFKKKEGQKGVFHYMAQTGPENAPAVLAAE